MRTNTKKGFALIPLIIAMALMAALGAGIYTVTTSSSFSELLATRDFNAYQLAKAGMRYAVFNNLTTNGTYCMSGNQCFTINYDPTTQTYTVVGKVNQGSFLAANRMLAYSTAPPWTGGSAFPRPFSDFDKPAGKSDAEWLGNAYTPTDNAETKINLQQAAGDNALNLATDSYTMGLKWYANTLFAPLDKIRADNGSLLSYGVQIKIYNTDEDKQQPSPYNIIGISFRLDDYAKNPPGPGTATVDNMYGISFVKLTKPNNVNNSDPDWYKTYIHSNSAWYHFSLDNAGKWFVVLWKRISAGGTWSYMPLAYQKLTSSDSVCREGDCTKIKYWSTIMVYVKETNIGNDITGYLASPESWPRSTTTPPAVLDILWAEKDGGPDPLTSPGIFKPINWTSIANNSVSTIFQDSSLTTFNYNDYTIGDTNQTKAREIGLHIFTTSDAANQMFYDNFYMDLAPSLPASVCSSTLSATNNSATPLGTTTNLSQTVDLTAASGCSWTTSNNGLTWITVTPANGTGTGSPQPVTYTASINTGVARNGNITIAGKTFTVNQSDGRANQTIGPITFNPTTLAVGGTTTASATATSGLVVTFSSVTPSICTVSGTTVTGVAAGTCTIAADQPGNATYNAAPQVTQSITVNKLNQTIGPITFNPTTLAVGGTTTASATATSGLVVTFSSVTPSICTVSGSTVTDLTAGTCTIAANQAGNANYNAAPQVTQNITVNKLNQTIGVISFSPTTLAVGGTTTASATATSGLAVTFSSVTPTICTVSGSTVTGVRDGTCTIAANQSGNTNYNAATQVTNNIAVTCSAYSVYNNTGSGQYFMVNGVCQGRINTNIAITTNLTTGAVSRYDKVQSNDCATLLGTITYSTISNVDHNGNGKCDVNYNSNDTASDK